MYVKSTALQSLYHKFFTLKKIVLPSLVASQLWSVGSQFDAHTLSQVDHPQVLTSMEASWPSPVTLHKSDTFYKAYKTCKCLNAMSSTNTLM